MSKSKKKPKKDGPAETLAVPAGSATNTYDQALRELHGAVESLVEIIEGPRALRWMGAMGVSLKETPDWCRLYISRNRCNEILRRPDCLPWDRLFGLASKIRYYSSRTDAMPSVQDGKLITNLLLNCANGIETAAAHWEAVGYAPNK